jgi:beta-galactosidase
MLHDYQSLWAYNHQPHHQDLSYWHQFVLFYSVFRSLGVDVDIKHPSDLDTQDYKLIVAPALTVFDETVNDLIRHSSRESLWLFGPRCGFKDATGKVPIRGQFDGVDDVLGIQLSNVDSLRPGLEQGVVSSDNENTAHQAKFWCESYDLKGAAAKYVYSSGPQTDKAAVTQKDNMVVVGALSQTLLSDVVRLCTSELGIATVPLPQGVRITCRAGKKVLFNFNQDEVMWGEYSIPGVSYRFVD